MKPYDFNNKTFVLIDNAQNGEADESTIFKYKQEGDLVTADYHGGSIRYGKIIARLENDHLENYTLNMLYQCLTTDNVLKAGKAIADVKRDENSKIQLNLKWEWLTDKKEKGESTYVEI